MSRAGVRALAGLAAALALQAAGSWAQETGEAEKTPALEASFTLQSDMKGTVFIRQDEPGPGLSEGEDRSWALATSQEIRVTVSAFGRVECALAAEVSVTDEDSEAAWGAIASVGVNEASVSITPMPALRFSAGIILPSFGNSFFFNATDWLSRYGPDPALPGGGSFIGAQARAGLGEWTFRLTLLPAFPDAAFGLYNEEPDNHVAALAVSRPLGPVMVVGSLFGEASPGFGALRGGAGLEAQAPVGEAASIDVQVLLSNGSPSLGLSEAGGILILSAREGSEAELFCDASIELEATIASLLQARIGYRYNGRGLDARSVARLKAEGYDAARAGGLETLLAAYSAVLAWPPSFLDHTLALSLAFPRMTETLGASLAGFASPFDLSAWLYLSLAWAPLENVQFLFSVETRVGAEGSLFRPFRREAAFSLSSEVSL